MPSIPCGMKAELCSLGSLMNKIGILLFTLLTSVSLCAYEFGGVVNEIRVHQDRVLVRTDNPGFGTCKEKDYWFGWATMEGDVENPRHKDWLSLALTAKATKSKITLYREIGACGGMTGAVNIDAVYLSE